MGWLTHPLGQYTVGWALLTALIAVISGFIGAGTKFLFDGLLTPQAAQTREARRLLALYTTPLTRSAEALERLINHFIRGLAERAYHDSEYYRLSTLYAFANYLAWVELVERDFGFVSLDSTRKTRTFKRRFYGFFRALTSQAYFRWADGRADVDAAAVTASAVPRNMLRAIGEVMVDDVRERRVKSFTDFTLEYSREPQFARWFTDLDRVLNAAEDGDSFAKDRLIAAGANLRALVVTLDPKNRTDSSRHIENRRRIAHPEVRAALDREFPGLIDTPRPAAARQQASRLGQAGEHDGEHGEHGDRGQARAEADGTGHEPDHRRPEQEAGVAEGGRDGHPVRSGELADPGHRGGEGVGDAEAG
jgi:hypothetical protein